MSSLLNLYTSLCSSNLFAVHPLPESSHDSLTHLLAHHFPLHSRPARRKGGLTEAERNGNYPGLVATLSGERRWRAIADLSAYELLRRGKAARTPSRDDVHAILRIWNTRLGCLCRLRHLANLASESTALFALLPPPYLTPLEPYSHVPIVDDAEQPQHFDPLMPFELVLTWAVLPSQTQADDLTALRRLGEVQEGCKREFWRTGEAVWTKRMHKTTLLRVNLLVQMQEYTQAGRILDQLVHTSNGPDNKRYLEAAFLLYTEMGDLHKAGQMKDQLGALGSSAASEEASSDTSIDLDTIGHLSQNRWEEAEASARKAMQLDPSNLASRNTVAVCCMYTGKISEGIELLEAASRQSPLEFYNEESCVSNLITLQELQAGDQFANKLDLLRESSKYASEGFRGEALRLQ